MRTNADLAGLKTALEWLGNQPKGEKAKHTAYNAFQLRVQLAVEAYRPLFNAFVSTEKAMVRRYESEVGEDVKYLENGDISFGPKLDRAFILEREDLMNMPLEDEPKRRAFTGVDFEHVGLAVPQSVLDRLGPLYKKPDGDDPDAIAAEDDAEGKAAESGGEGR